MLVLDILVGVLVLAAIFIMLPRYRKIGRVIEKQMDYMNDSDSEIVQDEKEKE